MPDLVDRPPHHLFHVERVGGEDALGRGDHMILRQVARRHPFVGVQLVEFDIHAEQVATFARQDQDVAFGFRRDQALLAHVREIGIGENIHHAPGLMRRVPFQLAADGRAHRRPRPVAADDVVRSHHMGFARVDPGVFEDHGHRMILGRGVDGQVLHLPGVIRHVAGRRLARDVEEQLVHPRLVDERVRHFGGIVGHVLHPPDPLDVAGVRGVRHPEIRLVHPVALALDLLAEAEGLKHLHRPGVDAVRLTLLDRAGFALDQHGVDLWKLRKLREQAGARGAGACDQHVDLVGQGGEGRAVAPSGRRLFQVRVTAAKAVFVILHGPSSSRGAGRTERLAN